jgi:hypothetical protein
MSGKYFNPNWEIALFGVKITFEIEFVKNYGYALILEAQVSDLHHFWGCFLFCRQFNYFIYGY